MRVVHAFSISATILSGALLATADAADYELRFWTWRNPTNDLGPLPTSSVLKDLVDDGYVVPMVHVFTSGDCATGDVTTPVEAVDQLEARIAGMAHEDIAVIMRSLGQGDGDPNDLCHRQLAPALFQHWCDALIPPVNCSIDCDGGATWCGVPCQCTNPPWCPQDYGMYTAWMDEGVCESRPWMEDFLAEWAARELTPPSRFPFDTEKIPGASLPSVPKTVAPNAFTLMQLDSRYAGTPLIGHGADTLQSLYQAVGSPPVDGTQAWSSAFNQDWSVWYDGIMSQTADHAMDLAFYSEIRRVPQLLVTQDVEYIAQWASVKSSNYETSIRVDGDASDAREPLRFYQAGATPWLRIKAKGAADLQAPELYSITLLNQQPGETRDQMWLRVHRENIEACINSYPADAPVPVTPWVARTGATVGCHYSSTKENLRSMLAMLRGKGINEIIMWSASASGDASDWEEFADLVYQVWGAQLVAYDDVLGVEQTGNDPDRLQESDWNWEYGSDAAVTRIRSTSTGKIMVDFDFKADANAAAGRLGFLDDTTENLRFTIDARLEWMSPTTLRGYVQLYNFKTRRFESIDLLAPDVAYVDYFESDSADPEYRTWQHQDPAAVGNYRIDDNRSILTFEASGSEYMSTSRDIRMRLICAADSPNQVDLLIDSVQVVEADAGLPDGSPGLGACCLPDDSCVDDISEGQCEALGGGFEGGGTDCSTTTCANGACCLGCGVGCVITTELRCEDRGGAYRGDGTTCTPDPCQGACCLPGGGCSVKTESQCSSMGGTYQGDATVCPAGCP